MSTTENSDFRGRLSAFLGSNFCEYLVISVILVNSIVLGLQTWASFDSQFGHILTVIDSFCLVFFVVELVLRIGANGWRFFGDRWNLVDFLIIVLSVLPLWESFSSLRALRVLRLFRLFSKVPELKEVITALARAVPGTFGIGLVLLILFYGFAVIFTEMYGGDPSLHVGEDGDIKYFDTIGSSLFTLFQIMTLEGWADITRKVMETHPNAWFGFLVFIIATTLTALNMFIAIIVTAMEDVHHKDDKKRDDDEANAVAELKNQVESLQQTTRAILAHLSKPADSGTGHRQRFRQSASFGARPFRPRRPIRAGGRAFRTRSRE